MTVTDARPTPIRPSQHPSLWKRTEARNEDWFDQDALEALRVYTRPLKAIDRIMTPIGIAVSAGFALFGGGRWVVDHLASGLAWPLQIVVILMVLDVLSTAVSIGPKAWIELVHDKRHGLSNMTPRLLAIDTVKGFVIGTILSGVLLSVLYAALRNLELWWLVGGGVFFGLQVVLVFVYPIWIMPRFNKFTPMPEGELRSRIEEIAALSGTEIEGVYVMDASKRTTRGNAFVAGLGKTARVVVFDTVTDWPIERLAQVVAHEIGHYRLHHTRKMLPVLGVMIIAGLGLVELALDWEWLAERGDYVDLGVGHPASLPIVAGVFGLFMTGFGLVQAVLSRRNEREADLEALELLVDPDEMMALWPALVADNKADLEPSWWKRLNASHPAPAERMQFALDWAQLNDIAADRPPKASVPEPKDLVSGRAEA